MTPYIGVRAFQRVSSGLNPLVPRMVQYLEPVPSPTDPDQSIASTGGSVLNVVVVPHAPSTPYVSNGAAGYDASEQSERLAVNRLTLSSRMSSGNVKLIRICLWLKRYRPRLSRPAVPSRICCA